MQKKKSKNKVILKINIHKITNNGTMYNLYFPDITLYMLGIKGIWLNVSLQFLNAVEVSAHDHHQEMLQTYLCCLFHSEQSYMPLDMYGWVGGFN